MKTIQTTTFLFLCFFFFGKTTSAQTPQLIISEIMYNPPEDGTDSLEYIEIYNNENTSVNLAGIEFSQGITYSFPNIDIAAQTYFVVAKDSVAFQNVFGTFALQWESGTLSNNGETLELINGIGTTIDLVEYQISPPTNGLGASVVLCDLQSDNNILTNWMEAMTSTGFMINEKEIIANPFENSECPIGPIIRFLESSISLLEDDLLINISMVLENGNANPTEVIFQLDPNSDAILNEDFTLASTLPITVTFPAGIEKDTQNITLQIIEDFNIESNEVANFSLLNPTNDAIVNPMHHTFKLIIEDDDATLPDLMISEIMYNPPETGSDSTEFIEIYNNDVLDVNLVNYYFSEGLNYTFPEVILGAGEYIVIARDSLAFANYYGFLPLEWTSGSLTNSGEILELRNPGGSVADVVEYSNTATWSELANGMGASLVLCDVNANNNDPTNWNSSISETGITIEGFELKADPNMENNCLIPLSQFPIRKIGVMTSTNIDGEIDSLNRKCELQGIVYGVNFNETNNGLQFVIIDDLGDGITVYNNSSTFGYSVNEGDKIMIQGTITQFNGLAEIIPDTLFVLSNNNTLTNPTEVTVLDESTESQLVEIKNLTIVNTSDWDNSDPNGFNVEVTNGTDIFEMRIDQDVDLFEMDVPNFSFNLTGLGGQYDSDNPFLEGYQILPRYLEDLEMITSTSDLGKELNITFYPNPINDFLTIEMNQQADKIEIYNILGQVVFINSTPDLLEKIDTQNWKSGIYLVSVFLKNEKLTYKIFK
ncbi:MAG: lamin tail domain-containing protein [Saprospiraceae bacterium]